jgi:hypothetical protein
MPGQKCTKIELVSHVANLRGGSQPILARATDGFLYVVKFADNPQGGNLLFNEALGSELFRACGLNVPKWKTIQLTDGFLDRNPKCWFLTPEGSRRPQAALCFASRYLGGQGQRLFEILPGNSFSRVRHASAFWMAWLIDACAHHADNRQALFCQQANGMLDATFVDFGHLFGGPKAEQTPAFQASRYLDARIYPDVSSQYLDEMHGIARCLDVDNLWQWANALPEPWKTASAFQSFALTLDRLSSHSLRVEILDAMLHSIRQGRQREFIRQQEDRDLSLPVLRFGVQAAGPGQGCQLESARHLACA